VHKGCNDATSHLDPPTFSLVGGLDTNRTRRTQGKQYWPTNAFKPSKKDLFINTQIPKSQKGEHASTLQKLILNQEAAAGESILETTKIIQHVSQTKELEKLDCKNIATMVMMEEYKKELRKKHFRKAKLDAENTEKEIAAELKSLRHAEKNHAMNSFADMSAPGGMVNSRNMRRVTIGSCRPSVS
jgi:hypothetical protein